MSEYGNEKFPTHTEGTTVDRRVLEEISRALANLRFGSIEITVHDGRVTQIESKRKIRLS
ncbi:MAG: YezD family protein [Spongiibacteraceae bacterium]